MTTPENGNGGKRLLDRLDDAYRARLTSAGTEIRDELKKLHDELREGANVRGISLQVIDQVKALASAQERHEAFVNMARGGLGVIGIMIGLLGYLAYDMRQELATKVDTASRLEMSARITADFANVRQQESEHERRDHDHFDRLERHLESIDTKIYQMGTERHPRQ
jgi:replicative DNA helicase